MMVDVTDDTLSALGLDRPGDGAFADPPVTYIYLVQVSTDGGRWDADWTEPAGGFERSESGPVQVARRVLRRRFLQLRADDDAHWRDLWFRVDVWTVGRTTADAEREGPGDAQWGRHLQSDGIAPDAVEVRTPVQVRREVGG
jgi:hypothetical protein